MKKLKKTFACVAVAAMTLLCVLAFAACGNKWPSSYTFNGSLEGQQGSAAITLELKEDNSAVMEGNAVGGVAAGKWTGTWKQNSDGTVTVTFAKSESDPVEPAPVYTMSLNDAETDLGGMGGLSITSSMSAENVNTLNVIINVALGGGYTMPFDGVLTQETPAEA